MPRAGRRPGSAPVAREARDYFGVSSEPTLAEIGSVADRYPVFRVMPRPNPGASTGRHGEERKDVRVLSYRTEMVMRRAPEEVFDYCSDLRSELQWNPNVKYVEKLTDGPVGVGTRYRARWANSGPTTVEVVQFDRPHTWETTAIARGMGIRSKAPSPTRPQGRATPQTWSSNPRGWPGWLRLLPCWPCDVRTSRTCTASGRRLSLAR